MSGGIGRRALLAAALARIGAATAEAVQAAGRSIPQRAAQTVRDGWGVCGAPGVDAPAEAYVAAMRQIGTRHLRAHLVQHGRSRQAEFLALRRGVDGLRVTALVTAYLNDPATSWASQQPELLGLAGTGLLHAIEGPNELNNHETGGGSHGPDDGVDRTGAFDANVAAWAEALARFKAAHAAALRGVALVAPSIASGRAADYARMPDVSASVDAGNMHFYAGGGRQPGFSLPDAPVIGSFRNVMRWAQAAQKPAGPMWMTEAGASTSGNYARDGLSQARYLANQILDFFAAGGERMFIYQLLDGSGREGDVEGNFGLFRHDLTPKPAALMLARLQRLLSAAAPGNAGPAFDAARLSVTGPGLLGRLVLPRPDGAVLLALWAEPVIDDGKGANVEPAPAAVTVELGGSAEYRVHDLIQPEAADGAPFTRAATVPVLLRGNPVLVEIRG